MKVLFAFFLLRVKCERRDINLCKSAKPKKLGFWLKNFLASPDGERF